MGGEFERKNSKLSALLAVVMVSTMVVVSSCAAEPGAVGVPVVVPSEGITPFLDIDGDDYVGERGLDTTISLNRTNGKYVNLYVNNYGEAAVTATINGQKERRFEPGEAGHIYLEVTQGVLEEIKITLLKCRRYQELRNLDGILHREILSNNIEYKTGLYKKSLAQSSRLY